MNRKIIIILILTIFGISLVSCDSVEDEIEPKEEYSITWKNYNGEILEIDQFVKEGSMPTYDGDIPTREGNEEIDYIFNGWSPVIDVVKEDMIYTATFTENYKDKEYSITWKNYNGEILEIDQNVKEGIMPTYDGVTPTREGNEEIDYIFNGWSPVIDVVKEDITYTATFTENYKDKEYSITWKNYNGDILEIDQFVKEGIMPTYDGVTPTREGNEEIDYIFNGWSPVINVVKEDITYTATFTENYKDKEYSITWENYNGEILEIDQFVKEGSMPTYDGATPTREGNEEVSYIFNGWFPVIDVVKEDMTYTATFIEKHKTDETPGIDPVISADNKTVQYGFYPQTHVNDENLIAKLNTLTPSQTNGWYLYNGVYYTKEVADIYNNESYTFDNGTQIVNGNEYWFECEPITWEILSNYDGTYFLLSSKLLDNQAYYKDFSNRMIDGDNIYANNYEKSDIRTWLNDYFYHTAFALNNTYIKETNVDNSASTSDSNNNQYASQNTNDKVFLPSYEDYLNSDYGFDSNNHNKSVTRECKTTDYARIRGAWANNRDNSLKYNSSYWTRSPSSEYYYAAWNVNSGGYLSEYAVDDKSHCVRPCISLRFEK